jgi:hypothetical protein
MWVATQDLPRSAAHPFYRRLNRVLDEAQFDTFVEGACATFYAEVIGRPSLAPGRYFRLLLLGYFEGLDSERVIAWRAADAWDVWSGPGKLHISASEKSSTESLGDLLFCVLSGVIAPRIVGQRMPSNRTDSSECKMLCPPKELSVRGCHSDWRRPNLRVSVVDRP